jgi:hypothetical protein
LKGQEQSGPLGAGGPNAIAKAGPEYNLEASLLKGGIFFTAFRRKPLKGFDQKE